MLSAEQLESKLKTVHPSVDLSMVRQAYDFAAHAHREQTRKSGEPYFVHPVSVADILVGLEMDVASICAGLLHDVVEDTDATVGDIEEAFGREVAQLVDGLTKLNRISFSTKEDQQAESFRKMVVAMAKDVRVLLIKLCDRLDNMRTMEHMKPASQERICRETSEIYAPLAHRLGMYDIKSELEDLALRYLEPAAHAELVKQLDNTRRERNRYIEGVTRTIEELLSERGVAAEATGRPRHTTSIFRKMRALQCDFDQIFDLVSFQVCVEASSDCYTALGVLHSRWTPVPGTFKDYIALTKPNRYQSLHTTVAGPGRQRLELHIRTHEMHAVAKRGVVAQAAYRKMLGQSARSEDAGYGWIREMEAYQRDFQDPAEFLEMVKTGLFPDEVFVFTPKGEVRVFPKGATVLDFAYGIHSEVGDHCAGARINGQRLPNRYKLRSGDQVEIITEPTRSPSKDWLDSCYTPRARSRVRAHLRAQHRRKSINLGKELLQGEMQRGGMSLTKLLKNQRLLGAVLEHLKLGSEDELMLGLGFGRLQAHQVVGWVQKWQREQDQTPDTPPPELRVGTVEKLVRKVTGREFNGVRVDGFDSVLVRFAGCCNPLPGDTIIGFITRGRGVAVHRRDCGKAFDTTDPKRRIEVSWGSGNKIGRPVSLRVTTKNTPGILADISQAFSAHKINLSEANCRASDDGSAVNTFTFLASDTGQLRGIIRSLNKVSGVVDVVRV